MAPTKHRCRADPLFIFSILVLRSVSTVEGQCYNQCAGHGECTKYGHCDCWSGFAGWDCSLRDCPSGPAWTDMASDTDTAHNDAVCSNRGVCNLETGECICHEHFEGRVCERMICPNDCSGHGQCFSMAEAAAGLDGYRLKRVASYDTWDAHMIYGCVCDDGYDGYDCSRRHCAQSDSGLTFGQQDETVVLYCSCGSDCTGSFKLRYKGQLATIHHTNDEATVASTLMALSTIKSDAAEYTSSPISVSFADGATRVCSSAGTKSRITFARDPGDLPPVYIKFDRLSATGGADVHMTTEATLVCTCTGTCGGHFRFVGEGEEATEKLPFHAGESLIAAALAELGDVTAENITVDTNGRGEACSDASTVNTSISIDLNYGNYPLKVVGSLYDDGQRGGEMVLYTNDGSKEQVYCAGLGYCDFDTGECSCDEDYGYDQEYGPCGQYIFTHSQWPGRQMCPGFELQPTIDILPSVRNDWQLYFTDAGKNSSSNITTDPQFDSTVLFPGYYWVNIEDQGTSEGVTFLNATNATTDLTNAFALDMTYRMLYYGQHNKVMRMPLPSDLSEEDLWASANGSAFSLSEVFVRLPEGEAAGYLEMDLRPDQRYLYWTVPGEESEPDGKVQRKKLSNDSDPSYYEDLSAYVQAGMTDLGYDLTDPLGIALDLRDRKIYFVDAQVRGYAGGWDGIVVRCELDGSGVEIAAHNLSDPRAIVLDVKEGLMYLTDTHIPSLLRSDMRNNINGSITKMETILDGVWQERTGAVEIETYFQYLLSPQALQFDTRDEDLSWLYFSDFETGYIYRVRTNGTDAKPYHLLGRPKSFIFDLGEGYPTFTLYTDCHGHGVCSGPPYFTCTCESGWEGNCQQKSCPHGSAWFDEAKTDGTAHAYAECSNRGHCDRHTSLCVCHDGFTGDACQRMTCPNDCSGNGKCLSMRQLALLATDSDLVPTPRVYGSTASNISTWDADSVFGCYCDWMGYQGGGPSYTNVSDWTSYDCSRKTCPTGDDSKTARYNATYFEQQNVSCALVNGAASAENASFSMSFRQGTTALMIGNVSISEFEEALESMVTIGDVKVGMWGRDSSAALCGTSGGQSASVVFKTELGDVPLLSAATSVGLTLWITEEVAGNKLDVECSRHGHCDSSIGECVCFDGWASSDGDGAAGHRLDCGWYPGDAGVLTEA